MNAFIAFPERLGKYGAAEYIGKRMGIIVDLDSRNMYQKNDGYGILRVDTRDVPLAVDKGALFGITGRDWMEDYLLGGNGKGLAVLDELDFGASQVCAFKAAGEIGKPARIISPYGNIAKKYSRDAQIDFCDAYGNCGEVQVVRGKTEGMLRAGIADIVVDNRSSGRTQTDNGLILLDRIMDSCAIVISRRENKYNVKEILGL